MPIMCAFRWLSEPPCSAPEGIKIGSNNAFEVGAQVYCSLVGDANVIETRGMPSFPSLLTGLIPFAQLFSPPQVPWAMAA